MRIFNFYLFQLNEIDNDGIVVVTTVALFYLFIYLFIYL